MEAYPLFFFDEEDQPSLSSRPRFTDPEPGDISEITTSRPASVTLHDPSIVSVNERASFFNMNGRRVLATDEHGDPKVVVSTDPLQKNNVAVWRFACWSLSYPAEKSLATTVPSPPEGFEPYVGVWPTPHTRLRRKDAQEIQRYKAAQDSAAWQELYIEDQTQLAQRIIETSPLAALPSRLKTEILEEIERLAKSYSADVDKHYNKTKEPAPGRYLKRYERALDWAARRTILRQSWGELATRNDRRDKIEKAVATVLGRLFLPREAAFYEKPGGKTGKSGRRKTGKSGG